MLILTVLLLTPPAALHAADTPPVNNNLVLVEAEGFATRGGGWVVDPQFMDIMGSPYLLAHGLGRPVGDASTEVAIPAAGTYRVWVRTKDWVAQWKAPGAPGRFQVLFNGRALKTTFGTVGAEWHWQAGRLHHKSLSEEHLLQVGVIPAGCKTFVLHADLEGVVVLQQAQSGAAEDAEVGVGVPAT